ncbi:uncharacterized protein LOC120196552 [Hibiscus syriacus]|uniref:uncharacterized protein LOC120196552 n=1 Tax=Hibiscus syriacus TaxID=106335 RepID=UPI00192196FF|nr:uncharacterized protein LOC120196552 [Hibiscus syriacus]
MGVPTLSGILARWKMLLSKFDIEYVSQKAIKGSAISNFLASRASENYEPLDFDFSDEDLMAISLEEISTSTCDSWKIHFDGASNALGHVIGAIMVSLEENHYPFTSRLNFDSTNNMTEKLVLDLLKKFDEVTFHYVHIGENQMTDALATLVAVFKAGGESDMQSYEYPTHCY